MNPKDYFDWYKALTSATMGLKDIEEQITKEIARLNNIKPIHFKNPEKLNGKYECIYQKSQSIFCCRL